MNMYIALILGIILLHDAHAFSMKKCSRTFSDTRGEGFSSQIVTGIFDTSSSSAQFTTSTGNCAAIGMTNEERAQSFYAFNYDKVLEDIAKSRGEYLASFEQILGCKVAVSKLRQGYAGIARMPIERQYDELISNCLMN